MGAVIYSGVDYGKILEEAEKEADIILWDGGNNDTPFYKPDLMITVVDPLRPGHEKTYYPGESNVYLSDVIVINKEDSATEENIEKVVGNVLSINKNIKIIHADSKITIENGEQIRNKMVIVVEDGPTLTHGGMSFGAGYQATKRYGGIAIDPRPFAIGSIKETYAKYPQSVNILPAMGYSLKQIKELEETVNNSSAEFVVSGTPIDLNLVMKINKPMLHANYELEEKGNLDLKSLLEEYMI
jgi:predicted GTPase